MESWVLVEIKKKNKKEKPTREKNNCYFEGLVILLMM